MNGVSVRCRTSRNRSSPSWAARLRAQHRAVAVPVVDEAVDERPRVVEPALGSHGVSSRDERRDLVADLFGEREHRFLDVAEVLVEGRRRRPDRARDVDDAQVADPVRLEQLGRRVEQAAARERTAPPERPTVERERRIHARYHSGAKSTNADSSFAGRKSARTRIPIRACSGSSFGSAAIMRAPSSSRSTTATTNGTRSLNGGTPFWRTTVNE